MPFLSITNHGKTQSGVHDTSTLFKGVLPPERVSTFEISSLTLINLEKQLEDIQSRVDAEGNALFTVHIYNEASKDPLTSQVATADVIRWAGNRLIEYEESLEVASPGSVLMGSAVLFSGGQLVKTTSGEGGDGIASEWIRIQGVEENGGTLEDYAQDGDVFDGRLVFFGNDLLDNRTCGVVYAKRSAPDEDVSEKVLRDLAADGIREEQDFADRNYNFVVLAKIVIGISSGSADVVEATPLYAMPDSF